MKIPQLKRKLEVKKYHDFELKDEFSWVHQNDILSVLLSGGGGSIPIYIHTLARPWCTPGLKGSSENPAGRIFARRVAR